MMNSDVDASKPLVDDIELDDEDDMSETAVLDGPAHMDGDSALDETEVLQDTPIALDDAVTSTDNVGDVSVEINVEELIADIEANEDKDAARKREIRRRLEDAVEDRSLDDTYAIDLDEGAD